MGSFLRRRLRRVNLEAMDPRRTARTFLGVAALAWLACGRETDPETLAFPSARSGQLDIHYPLDETLFPPEIVAPTFAWKDDTHGVQRWTVLVRLAGHDEPLRFTTSEPRWQPAEHDWQEIKRRSATSDAEVA